jgi:hypothetical protein
MNHITGRQAITRSQLRIADLAAAQRPAFPQQFRSGRAMNRAVDAAPTQQACIGRIDDRIDRQGRDVGLFGNEFCSHRCSPTKKLGKVLYTIEAIRTATSRRPDRRSHP